MNEEEKKLFKCPLCESILSENKYYQIIGAWDDKKKVEEELKKQLSIAKNEKEKLEAEKKKLAKDKLELKKNLEADFEKQKSILIKKAQEDANKLARKDVEKLTKEKAELIKEQKQKIALATKQALEEGIEKQKKKFEVTNKILEKRVNELDKTSKAKDEQIKELQKRLKEGRTPQDAGHDFENELVQELKQKFPQDRIEHHGQGGDILHYVVCEGKEIASIVYECKKTETFNKEYINQIKDDVIKRNANYGILVTFAEDKKHPHFWVEKDILIVHPYGAPYLAEVLRKSLIQLYSMKLNDKEISDRAKKLLEYIKGNKFRNSVKDNIIRTRELYELLNKEMEYHKTLWEKRHKHYNAIAQQSKEIEDDSKNILGENLGEELNLSDNLLEIKSKKKRKIFES
jgi:hypothetical protein